MDNAVTVSLYTQVYNTRPFLARCIESVLKQTFCDFEYILIDNGSTDGSGELLEQYARQDERIKLIRFEENRRAPIWQKIAAEVGNGRYISNLDSDDWIEATFLEQLVNLADQMQLDIVCTGTMFCTEKNFRTTGERSLPQRLVIEREQLSKFLPYYHAFYRTTWAKLVRRDVFARTNYSKVEQMIRDRVFNGADTITSFAWLRAAKRVCVDNSVLHNYLIRAKSVYHDYNPTRFLSNTILYEDAMEFLSGFGPVSQENRRFLALVYANGIYDALEVLASSTLSTKEKVQEYCTIASHPITQEVYKTSGEAIEKSRERLLRLMLTAAANVKEGISILPDSVQALCPRCGQCVSSGNAQLFCREAQLMEPLLRDDWDALVKQLICFMLEKRYVKQFDLVQMIHRLIPDESPLSSVTDIRFFQKYPEVVMLILSGNHTGALDHMAGLLLEEKTLYEEKTFIRIFLQLAKQINHEAAIIFGSIRLAKLYLHEDRREECQDLVRELREMGVEENAALMEICRELGEDDSSWTSSRGNRQDSPEETGPLLQLAETQQRSMDALAAQLSRVLAEQQSQRTLLEAIRTLLATSQTEVRSNLKSITEQSQKLGAVVTQTYREAVKGAQAADEAVWAAIYNNTVSGSTWLIDKVFSPGRWAVGYPYLYAMYRVLDEARPKRILELGLGQSTRMIAQYAAYYPGVEHFVVEHDPVWINFFANSFPLPQGTKIVRLDRKMVPYKEAPAVRVFDKFNKTFAGQKFDFISVDAPLAGDMTQYARIDILGLLPDCLSKDFVIMVDDINGAGTAHTVMEIQDKLKAAQIPFSIGVYKGNKECALICASHMGFLTSM